MDNLPWYIQWGSILGFFATVLVILTNLTKLPQLWALLLRSCRQLWGYLMMALSMISNWWWWKKCQPTWHIKEYDCIEVSKESPGRYRIELKMKAGYINNDKRYQLSFESVPMLFVSHEGSGRERQPFILQTHDQGIKYIGEDRSGELDHIFWRYTTGKPIFKDTTKCRIKGVNWARIALHNRTLEGKFKLEGSNEFTAKVRNIE